MASVSVSSGVFMWWPRTVPIWMQSGNSVLLLLRARVVYAISGHTWTVRGHTQQIASHSHFHLRLNFNFSDIKRFYVFQIIIILSDMHMTGKLQSRFKIVHR